jgi:hypothetical protein
MKAIFLAPDRTYVARPVAHVHMEARDDEDEECTYYEPTFFILDIGTLVVCTSSWAEKHVGDFVGVCDDAEDPELFAAQMSSVNEVKH